MNTNMLEGTLYTRKRDFMKNKQSIIIILKVIKILLINSSNSNRRFDDFILPFLSCAINHPN